MSTVYEAADAEGHRVALKLLHPHVADSLDGRERMRREFRMLRKVKGPYVAEVLDIEADDEDAFIVTQLIDGPTLEDDVVTGGIYTEEDLADLARKLQDAVASIHSVGVLHRDLKPSNVMMKRGKPVLIDFGIAQLGDDPRITQQGSIAQSPGYTDPQVLRGAEPSMEADWWSLAAVLAYAATGYAPFGTDASIPITNRVLSGQMNLPGLSPQLTRAFERALAPDPASRISFDELIQVVESPEFFDDDESSSADSSHTAPASAAAGAGVAAAALATDVAHGGGQPSDGATEVLSAHAPIQSGEHSVHDQGNPLNSAAPGGESGATEVLAASQQNFVDQVPLSGETEVFPQTPGDWQGGAENFRGAGDLHKNNGLEDSTALSSPAAADAASTQVFSAPPAPQHPLQQAPFTGSSPNQGPPSYGQSSGQGFAYSPQNLGQASYGQVPGQGMQQPYPQGYVPEVPLWLRPPEPAKLIIALIGASFTMFSATVPVISVAVFAALSIFAAVIGVGFESLNRRRLEKGGRFSGEQGWVAVRALWFAIKGTFTQLPGFLIGGVFGMLTIWLITMVGLADVRLAVSAGAAVAMCFSWFMVPNRVGREGARRIVKAVAPSMGYRMLWVVVWVAMALIAFIVARGSGVPDWYPMPTPFFVYVP